MGIALGAIAVSLFVKNAVPALQGVTAMQVCYSSLATVTDIHPLQSAMYETKSIAGFNEGAFNLLEFFSSTEVAEA